MRATNCCCGVPLHTAVVVYGTFDVIIGVIYTIWFLAGISRLSFAPDFGVYEVSWVISSVAEGFLAIVGGFLGIWAVQKRDGGKTFFYGYIKALQYVCMLVSCILILVYLDEISEKLTDETIDEMIAEAARKHLDPPKIDRAAILSTILLYLRASCQVSLFLWTTFGLYGLYIIYSLAKWYSEGRDPGERRLILSIPSSQTGRVQYISPLLQGQTPMIPIAIG